MNEYLLNIAEKANAAKGLLSALDTNTKNKVLKETAKNLIASTEYILAENQKDMEKAVENNMPLGLQDRLLLNEDRIVQIAEGLKQVADLEDPIGEIGQIKQRPNGLMVGTMRVPLGVVGVIYEARPNVTADVFALCFKTGNASILKGGKDAFYSNKAIVSVITQTLQNNDIPSGALQLIEDNSRQTTNELMKMHEYVDVLIPRGGAGLIASVVQNATIPVIETGTGNCHIYVDEDADLDMACNIIINAKTTRIGVCNSCESLVIHENVLDQLAPVLAKKLQEKSVEIRADEKAMPFMPGSVPAVQKDWGQEYLDLIISVKVVGSLEEAIDHINQYSTKHSEAIVTNNYFHAQKFLKQVDSAAVYVNASTRFTDGFEFGFGAEIGISTQKLHARGPMGLKALTSTKYIIYGSGQIRE